MVEFENDSFLELLENYCINHNLSIPKTL